MIRYQLKRTRLKGKGPPKDLLVGELAANIGNRPPILWIGTQKGPTKLGKLNLSIAELERLAKLSFDMTLVRQLDADDLEYIIRNARRRKERSKRRARK